MDEKAAAVWSDPDTYAACLLALGLDRYRPKRGEGPEHSPVHWLPQTWNEEVRDDCGVDVHPRNRDRLAAACLLLQNPHEFYDTSKGFSAIASGMAAVWFEPDVWHPPTAEEALWALIESHLIHPPEDDEKFSAEVVRYVNMIVKREGFRHMPPAFAAFGIPTDAGVWRGGPALDYSAEPDLALAVEQAAADRERDLDLDVADRLRDLAQRIGRLPVAGDKSETVTELLKYADKISAEVPVEPD